MKAFKPCPLTEKKIERAFVKQTNTHIAIFAQYYIIAIKLLCVNFSWKKKLGANSLFDEIAGFLKGVVVLSAVLSAVVSNGEVLLVWLFS